MKMKTLILLLFVQLVVGDYYKETQNFKYSRTSPEDGEKKGFFEAQSGNMGGNYEVSRNMDTLAQRQLHDLKHQVGSQLGIDPLAIGNGAVQTDGPSSVYGSASTSGTIKGSLSDHNTQQATRDYHNTANAYNSNAHNTASAYNSNAHNTASAYNSNQRGYERGSTLERNRASSIQNAGMSSHSLNTDYDDSQRVLDASATTADDHWTGSSGHYVAGSTGSRRVTGTRYQTTSSLADTDGTNNVRYEPGPYVPKSSRSDSLATGSQYHGASSRIYDTYGAQSNAEDTQRSGSGITRVYVPAGGVVVKPASQIQAQNVGTQSSFSSIDTSAREYETSGARTSGSTVVRPGTSSRYNFPERTVVVQPAYVRTGDVSRAQHFSTENSQTHSEDSDVRTVHVQPGTRIHIKARPNQPVRVVVPAQTTHTQQIDYSGTHGVDQNSETTSNVYVEQPERNLYTNQDAQTGTGGEARRYQSSYSYQKAWEKHGSTADNVRERDVPIRPVTNLQSVAQNRDKLIVSGLDLGTENQVSGSAQTTLGRNYGSSSQTRHAATNSGYRGEMNENTAGGIYNNEEIDTTGTNVNRLSTQPKSYQSSYSYHKSWERHGTPYQILPSGETVPITSDSQTSGRFDNRKGDMATSASEGQSRYIAGQSSSRHSTGAQYGSTYGASQTANNEESMDTQMSAMQERLKNQMKQMCPDCGGTKTKGYSASYSYSAQRGYGGNEQSNSYYDGQNVNHRS